MTLRVVSPRLGSCSVSRQRETADGFAQVGKADAGGARTLRNEAVLREAGKRVGLQTEDAMAGIHAEVDAAVAPELERAVGPQRGILQRGGEVRRQLRRELLRHAGRVLALVIEEL